jgi:hypothetical protein
LYAHPTPQLSPGDIFPSLPFAVLVSPLRVARKHAYNPPAGRGPAEFRRIYTLPGDAEQLPGGSQIETQQGEETLAANRVVKGMLLTWGSQIEADERTIEHQGRVGKKGWLAAPIYRIGDVPENHMEEDPVTHARVPLRELIRENKCRDNFYLLPLPGELAGEDHYVELRKITPIGVQFFLDSRPTRIATLTQDSLNELFSALMWSLTRAELFFRPITCECGREVPIDVRFHGQNFDAEPWE